MKLLDKMFYFKLIFISSLQGVLAFTAAHTFSCCSGQGLLSSCSGQGLLSSCSARLLTASLAAEHRLRADELQQLQHKGLVSGSQAERVRLQPAVARGLSGSSSWALAQGLSSCGE